MQSLVWLATPFVQAQSTHKCLPDLHSKLEVILLLERCDLVKVMPFTFSLVRAITICTTCDQSISLQCVLEFGTLLQLRAVWKMSSMGYKVPMYRQSLSRVWRSEQAVCVDLSVEHGSVDCDCFLFWVSTDLTSVERGDVSWPCKSTLSIEDVELRRERGGLLALVRPSLGATDDLAASP